MDLSNILNSFISKEGLAGFCMDTSLLDRVTIDCQITVVHENVIASEKLHYVNDDVVRNILCSISEDLAIPIL